MHQNWTSMILKYEKALLLPKSINFYYKLTCKSFLKFGEQEPEPQHKTFHLKALLSFNRIYRHCITCPWPPAHTLKRRLDFSIYLFAYNTFAHTEHYIRGLPFNQIIIRLGRYHYSSFITAEYNKHHKQLTSKLNLLYTRQPEKKNKKTNTLNRSPICWTRQGQFSRRDQRGTNQSLHIRLGR